MTTTTSLFGGIVSVPTISTKDPIDPILTRDIANNILHHQDMQTQPLVNWQGIRTFDGVGGGKHDTTASSSLLFSAGPIRLARTVDDAPPKFRIRMAGYRLAMSGATDPASFYVAISPGAVPMLATPGSPPDGGILLAQAISVTSGTSAWLTLLAFAPYTAPSLAGTQQTISTYTDTGGSRAAVTYDTCFISVYGGSGYSTLIFPVLTALHVSEVY